MEEGEEVRLALVEGVQLVLFVSVSLCMNETGNGEHVNKPHGNTRCTLRSCSTHVTW